MRRTTSIFCQMLSIIPKKDFLKNVIRNGSDRYSKGFNSWEHFVSMLFCQLAQAKSLREICKGLKSCVGKLNHLGMYRPPTKSNLSYANKHRPWELYQQTFYDLLEICRRSSPGKKKKFRFKNKLYSLDASIIDLCIKMFDWAKFRQKKGAIKLHLLLDHDGYLPSFVHITDGKTHEVNIAKIINIPAESVVAIDKGYTDYKLFYKWTQKRIWFVTKMKSNTKYRVKKKRKVPKHRNIISDEIIEFTGYNSRRNCPIELRHVVVWDLKKNCEIVLLTNHLSFGATTIASIYKDRWEIEIFFKIIKQNLRVKTFVGTSTNAVKIQIWTALIAILLIKYLKFKSKYNWSMSNLVALLKWNLFTYKDLWVWIDDPFEKPPDKPNYQRYLPFWDSKKDNKAIRGGFLYEKSPFSVYGRLSVQKCYF